MSLLFAFIWLILANVIAMFPSRDAHWRNAYTLIALGIPLIGWVTYENGPFWALFILAGAASVLRWPLIHLWRWAKTHSTRPAE